MERRVDYHQTRLSSEGRLRWAVALSVAIHLVVLFAAAHVMRPRRTVLPATAYQVQLYTEPIAGPTEPAVPEPEPVRPPEPKPEPKLEPERKPEVQIKEDPKPKPEPKRVARREPKQDAQPKPKTEPKVEPKPEAAVGVSVQQELPSALGAWARIVQRKVDRCWQVPAGVRMDSEANQAEIAVWVSRDGEFLARPVILKEGEDLLLAESALQALEDAAPFPPFPDGFSEPEQQVIFTFRVSS